MTPTLKTLNALLANAAARGDLKTALPLTKNHCETYGRKTFAYFICPDLAARGRVEHELTVAGAKVGRDYCRKSGGCDTDSPNVEVRVSYLRAHGWNE